MRTAILGKGMWIGRRPTVLTIGNYVKVKTLEEAYELNQARNSRIMGGMMWMRLGNARVKTIIDMSELGLNEIMYSALEQCVHCASWKSMRG